ncbi:hypothetical protein Tco_1187282 [Tanacetum coccineum]
MPEEFGSHMQSTSRNSTNLPTNTSELPQHKNKNVILIPRSRLNNSTGQFGIRGKFGLMQGMQKARKRVRDSTITRKDVASVNQAEKGVQLQAEQSDWQNSSHG